MFPVVVDVFTNPEQRPEAKQRVHGNERRPLATRKMKDDGADAAPLSFRAPVGAIRTPEQQGTRMNREPTTSATVIPGVAKNIETIMQIEQEFLRRRSSVDRLSDLISRVAGTISFVIVHLLCLAAWIVVNTGLIPGVRPFDPYPFSFLALVVAMEVLLLSTFVLMSQNRQNHQADHRAHLRLQIGLLAEQETTKILQMLHTVCDRLGLEKAVRDQELKEMKGETAVDLLAQELTENLKKTREDEMP